MVKYPHNFIRYAIIHPCLHSDPEELVCPIFVCWFDWHLYPEREAGSANSANYIHYHYGDVIMGVMASQIASLTIVLFRRRSTKTSKLRVTGLCEGNSPVTRWIPHTKGQYRQKCFNLMTSSWLSVGWNYLSIPILQRLHRWGLGMDK